MPSASKVQLPEGEVFFKLLASPITAQFVRIRREQHPARGEQCALCRASLQEGDAIVLCLSNQRVFPNCMVHVACMGHTPLLIVAERLAQDWQEAQQYAHWF